jgi:hypothetical protein
MVLFSAAIHIVPGIAVLALLVMAGLKHHLTVSEAVKHLRAAWSGLLFVLVFAGGGVYALVRPSGMLGWARSAYPDIPEDDPFGLVLVRVIGAGLCLMGLVVLFAVVS